MSRSAMPSLAQARALETLVSSTRFVGTSSRTSDREIQGAVARALEKRGWAKGTPVLPDDSVVTGAALAHLLGYWKTKYKITRAGKKAWGLWVLAHSGGAQ